MTHLKLAQGLRVDRICTRFEQELKAQRSPRIEDYLEGCPGELREHLLSELLALELWYAHQGNSSLAIAEYLERFPDNEAIVRDCFAKAALPPVPDPACTDSTASNSCLESADPENPDWCRATTSIEIASQFGPRYRILKRLGEGGMGNVYLAYDEVLERKVALKVPRLSGANGPEGVDRFRREAQAAARVDHHNLCPVYDIGEVEGVAYLTMQYVEGRSLAEYILQRRPVSIRNTIAIVRKVAQALAEAHTQGVIHRDLKPSNIMINPLGEPVVVDFGLARTDVSEQVRLTTTGAIIGTLAYASPEQIESHCAVDARTDIYGLGVILYELLTGRLPFRGSSPVALLQQTLLSDPPPPSSICPQLAQEWDGVCLKAIAKRPEDRYQTMHEFDEAIEQCAALIRQADDSRPDWFQPPLPGTPDRLARDEGIARGEQAEDVRPSGPADESQRWTARWRSIGQTAVTRIAPLRQLPTMAAGALLMLGAMTVWPHLMHVPPPPPPPIVPPPIVEPVPPAPERVEPPEFRVQLPAPVGGSTFLSGSLWHLGLDLDEPIRFNIWMRCVENREEEPGKLCQVIEFDVETLNSKHKEQASFLVDVDRYRETKVVQIHEGWILAPRDQVFAKFDPDVDSLAVEYANAGVTLPSVRLSVQDVLALLFKAESGVTPTNDRYRTMQANLRDVRLLNDQVLEITPPTTSGTGFTLVKTKDAKAAEPLPVKYAINICEDAEAVPFSWGDTSIDYRPQGTTTFRATLSHEGGGVAADNIAEFNPPEWIVPETPPPPREEYAYLTLPEEEGAWCQFEVTLLAPPLPTVKLNRVEVRVLNQEVVDDVPYRWIEVEVQTGGDFDSHRIVETVKLLVNEQRYRQERKFEFLQDPQRLHYQAGVKLQIGNQKPLYARFDPVEDRMEKCHGDQVPLRVRIRNVLSLLFGAELEPNIVKFDIRKHISYALTDARMKRYFIHNKAIPLPEQEGGEPRSIDPCILVRPGASVSIVATNDVKPTTLDYDIYISQDPAEFPFRWVDMKLDLYEELKGKTDGPPPILFGGRLKLRDFGRSGAKSAMGQSMEWIVTEGDPQEAEAYAHLETYSKLADRLLDRGNRSGAREQYEKFLEKHSGSLAAHEARARIDSLK